MLTPSETGERERDGETEPVFPDWALDGLADRWSIDRRARVPAMGFEIRRD